MLRALLLLGGQVSQTPPRTVRFYQEVGAMEIPQLDTNGFVSLFGTAAR